MPGVLIGFFRLKQLSVTLTLSVALCLFNISINFLNPVDLPDERDFSDNEIESFAEFVVEEVGACDDFFKEYDENESESSLQKSTITFLGVLHSSLQISYSSFCQVQPAFNPNTLFQYSAFLTISTPPPKFSVNIS